VGGIDFSSGIRANPNRTQATARVIVVAAGPRPLHRAGCQLYGVPPWLRPAPRPLGLPIEGGSNVRWTHRLGQHVLGAQGTLARALEDGPEKTRALQLVAAA
jgi:hypothetical protein